MAVSVVNRPEKLAGEIPECRAVCRRVGTLKSSDCSVHAIGAGQSGGMPRGMVTAPRLFRKPVIADATCQSGLLIEKHQLARECACLARGSSSLRTLRTCLSLANVKDGQPKPGVGWRLCPAYSTHLGVTWLGNTAGLRRHLPYPGCDAEKVAAERSSSSSSMCAVLGVQPLM
jgi:hypothetical protein